MTPDTILFAQAIFAWLSALGVIDLARGVTRLLRGKGPRVLVLSAEERATLRCRLITRNDAHEAYVPVCHARLYDKLSLRNKERVHP